MTITFQINYRAQWGETMCILSDDTNVLSWTEKTPLPLTCQGQDFWSTTIPITDFVTKLSYRYAILRTDGTYYYEGGKCRQLDLTSNKMVVRDFWQVDDYEKNFCTKAFKDVLFRRQNPSKPIERTSQTNICLQISVPQVLPNQGVAVMGNTKALGNWRSEDKLVMSDSHFPYWEASFEGIENEVIEYKYVIFDIHSGAILDMEYGENRQVWGVKSGQIYVLHDQSFRRTQPRWKGAGVAVPIFSLRTEKSFGIGEYQDLKQLADWASKVGMKMIQTLPINDTTIEHTNQDSYPYKAVSVFALHPIYLNVEQMGHLTPTRQKRYLALQKEFNAKNFADYQAVYDEKTRYFKALFKSDKEKIFSSEEYKIFFEKNSEWLVPYSLFMSKRDKQPKEYYYYLQFHADRQLADAVRYVHSLGIVIKGDIPIGISAASVDAANNPRLFNLSVSAGAPPDDFDSRGQNWGFPTYNWDVMALDNYHWWQRRFIKMQDYFDAYRIDHILGFFRIWQMPKTEVWGLCGHFVPALPYTLQELWNKGIKLDEERLTTPYIRNSFLRDLFGKNTEKVKRTYFTTTDGNTYHFKEEYDTQVKVQANVKNEKLRNALLALHCEVLFVRDQSNHSLLHPRIALYNTHSYGELWDDQKHILLDIHNDYFYFRHTNFWRESALKKLPTLINATDMLVCGEDLGMVPSCVPEVMKELQILSLEIQRMPKYSSVTFAHPSSVPYLSVCTTGTHDTNPLRAWWEEDVVMTNKFYHEQMGRQGEAPSEMTPEIARFIVNQHVYSPAMWVILPLQDWLATDGKVRQKNPHAERINVPSNPHHFWNYRMHINLEDLLCQDKFNEDIKALIAPRI